MGKDKKMDKIIFFDIDGTLHYPGIGVPGSAVNALEKLKNNGHKMVMCTGRSRGTIPDRYFKLGFDGMIIGAGTYVEYEGKVLHRQLMSEEEISKVVTFGREENIGIILEGEEYGYYDPENQEDYYQKMKKETETNCEVILHPLDEARNIPKWTYHHLDPARKDQVEEMLNGRFKGIYHEPLDSIEFIPKDVNKAKGIEEILEYTKIPRKNTYAFGDSANDIDMIKYVTYGIAMGNAVKELQDIAPYHTARADEDGIEKGLKKFGLID